MSKQPPPIPTASAIDHCPTLIKVVGRPVVVVVVLLFYVHGKHLRSCRDGQST